MNFLFYMRVLSYSLSKKWVSSTPVPFRGRCAAVVQGVPCRWHIGMRLDLCLADRVLVRSSLRLSHTCSARDQSCSEPPPASPRSLSRSRTPTSRAYLYNGENFQIQVIKILGWPKSPHGFFPQNKIHIFTSIFIDLGILSMSAISRY